MAYDHGKYVVTRLGTGTANLGLPIILCSRGANADAGRWYPGYTPHIVRAVAITNLVTTTKSTKPVIDFRTATGGVVSTSGGTFARITLVSAGQKKGILLYRDGLNTEVQPGDAIVVSVKTAATTVAFPVAASLYVEARWEKPTNLTRMTLVTA